MKRTIFFLMTCLLLAGCAVASGPSSTEPSGNKVHIAGMKGATSMGMAKMIEDSNNDPQSPYEFQILAGADLILPKLLNGELDIAALPVNSAAILFEKTKGEIQVISVNTLGVLQVVETGESIQNLADLKGEKVLMTGQGTVPEFSVRAILANAGVSLDQDLEVSWKSEPGEVVALLKEQGGIAILPQPFVTAAQTKVENLRIALDLTEEWEKLNLSGQFVTGVFVARTGFATQFSDSVEQFLVDYDESVHFVNSNPQEAGGIIGKLDIVEAPIAEKAIPNTHLVNIRGEEMEEAVQGFLNALYEQDPASVGGILPDDAFYYK